MKTRIGAHAYKAKYEALQKSVKEKLKDYITVKKQLSAALARERELLRMIQKWQSKHSK